MRTLLREGKTEKVQEYINALSHGEAEDWYHAQPFLDFIQALTAAHDLGDPRIAAICDAVDRNVQSLIVTTDVDHVYTELQAREVAVEKIFKATQASAIWQRWKRNHLRVVIASSMDLLLPLISHGLRSCDVLIMSVTVSLNDFAHRVEVGKTIWVVPDGQTELPPLFSTKYEHLVSTWVEEKTDNDIATQVWPIETKGVLGKKRPGTMKSRRSENNGQKQLKLDNFGIRSSRPTTNTEGPSKQSSADAIVIETDDEDG
eukprot:GEMP01032518.1.p1 GENE.GEMP01032518.1~~GEMP01032518.1.p1  ORF type:complete len:259 (+),score=79.35 GEMP01032518.1:807-1583(+)